MSTAISVRIPDILASKLLSIAQETERPKSFHIQKALELDDQVFYNILILLTFIQATALMACFLEINNIK